MSKEIGVNSVELVPAASNAQTAIDNLNASLDEWSKQGEKSIAIKAFSQQFLSWKK